METTETYWIARNEDNSVIHYGENINGGKTITGQPILEEFATKEEYENRLIELGINIE